MLATAERLQPHFIRAEKQLPRDEFVRYKEQKFAEMIHLTSSMMMARQKAFDDVHPNTIRPKLRAALVKKHGEQYVNRISQKTINDFTLKISTFMRKALIDALERMNSLTAATWIQNEVDKFIYNVVKET